MMAEPHAVCGVDCKFECKNNISNMQVLCPFCESEIQVWRLSFAITHLDDPEVVGDALTLWADDDEPVAHALIHVPESY